MESAVRVEVETIGSAGEVVTLSVERAWARSAATMALECVPRELDGTLELNRSGTKVTVTGCVRASFDTACDRCGHPTSFSLDTSVELTYYPARTGLAGETVGADELDIGWYEGGALDMESVLSEALALALPNRILCEDQHACETRAAELSNAGAPEKTGHPGFQKLAREFEA